MTDADGNTLNYDENGNLTDDGTYLYYYDCENRLTDVNDQNDAAAASYSYDYLGRRVKKTQYATPDTQYYVYDGDQVIAEYDSNDTLLRKFVYGPNIDEPVCMIDVTDGNKVYYYHFDGLGSVFDLTDTSGTFVEYYEYDVFGEPTIWDANAQEIVESSVVGNPYMFTGRRFDAETSLYYYRARYYDPYIGRFLQTDPIYYAGGLNLYTYVRNNPVNWTDPWGLQPIMPMSPPSHYVPFPDKDVPPMPTWGRSIIGGSIGAIVSGCLTGHPLLGAALGIAAGVAYTELTADDGEAEAWDIPDVEPPAPPEPPEGPTTPDDGGDDGGGATKK